MYTTGVTTLCKKVNFSSSTSIDEIKAYILNLTNVFCSVTGLVIMPRLTREMQYGIAYYLGKTTDDEYPLLCIANPGENSSYFYRSVYIGGVNSNLYTFEASTSFSWSNSNRETYYWLLAPSTYTYLIKYLVKDDSTILYGISPNENNSMYKGFVATITNGTDISTMHFVAYQSSLYFTYCPEMGVTGTNGYNVESLSARISFCYCVPLEKDALLSVFMLNNWKVTNVLKFTNRAQYAKDSILLINGKRYIVAYTNGTSYLSLLLLLD